MIIVCVFIWQERFRNKGILRVEGDRVLEQVILTEAASVEGLFSSRGQKSILDHRQFMRVLRRVRKLRRT